MLLPHIDPRAVVHEDASLADDVVVEPFAVVGQNVRIGRGTRIGSMAFVDRNTEIGEECLIFHGAVVGTDPQDLKFENEETFLRIGDRTTVREFATLNRATGEGEATVIGDDGLIMAYAHVAHNCIIGDHVVIVNAVNIAGHVEIADWATIGGMTAVQQFIRIGQHAYVGGACRVSKDVPPFFKIGGIPTRPIEVNTVGLLRRGFSEERLNTLRKAYRLLYLSDLNTTQAVERIRRTLDESEDVEHLVDFIESSSRGIIK
ncbi:MAG: acyl-ACP--UDP-N-acetylglucosamine O-acyltransferase [Candidatus Eisenbacteria bacterium]|nr:acyl-ACP--UDP-N-acetylglucosamine O-acyltransferase [Candidatus Eisenbacteria bacterium]